MSETDAADEPPGHEVPVPSGTEPSQPMARRVRRGVLAMAVGLGIYYAAPVGSSPSVTAVVLSVAGILAGMAILVWLVYRQVQRLVRSRPGDTSVRLEGLVLVVYLIVPMFSLGYFTLADADPSQFDEMETKTDSLYFTVSTLATVGFGDVHATGQLARALVTLQMVFDLVFVAAVASLLSTQLRERAAQRRQDHIG